MVGEPARGDDEIVSDVLAGSGAGLVTAAAPDDVALALVEALDADLVESDELGDAVASRLDAVGARTTALAALELHARLDGDAHRHVVTDLGTLRALVDRIDRADRFVIDAREFVRERASASSELAVHPESIRKAAAEVTEARAAQQAIEVEIAELEAAVVVEEEPAPEPVGRTPGLTVEQRSEAIRAVGAVVLALLLGILVLVVTGSSTGLLLPVIAVGWAGYRFGLLRQDVVDRDVAAHNLAAVSAMADQAYGGAARAEPDELVDARRRLDVATERTRYAESAWASLVGPDVDVAELDAVLAGRDAQLHVGDDELARTPTLKAAEAHARRLRAQWKLAWWALDRPVPPIRRAASALDELAREGVEVVAVESWEARAPERVEAEAELERIAGGRSIDDLRVAANASPRPLVVLDESRAITAPDLAARTAVLPSDVRVVVVQPAADTGGPETDG